MNFFGQNFQAALASLFTLGVRSEKEASNASLSLRHLSLWLKNESPSPMVERLSVLSGVPTVKVVQTINGGLGCCPIWQPRSIRLPQLLPLCKTVFVQTISIGKSLGLVRGTPSPQKQRAARCKTRYGKQTPDEYDEKDNPGNEQLFDAATGAASRSLASLPRVVNLSRSIPDLLIRLVVVAPSGKCQGTRLLCKKIIPTERCEPTAGMKLFSSSFPLFSVAATALLTSTGCYDILMVNVGSSAHTASSVGKPLAPEVQCAALAQPGVTIVGASIDAMKVCEEAVAEQKAIDAKAKHK